MVTVYTEECVDSVQAVYVHHVYALKDNCTREITLCTDISCVIY
jgi:hypothetical protein